MSDKTGGAAFPQSSVYDASRDQVNPANAYFDAEGMTLRDYFAAKAMQGYCAVPAAWDAHPSQLAKSAYLLADAMLAARDA